MRYTKDEREAYNAKQKLIKEEHERFSKFMSEHGWKEYHLFMRGTKYERGDDVVIHDMNGWHLNGSIVPYEQIMETVEYNKGSN